MLLCLLHRFFRALTDALPAFNAQRIVNHRKSFGVLGNGADRASFDQRADMVVRANILVYLYHDLSVYDAKLSQINRLAKYVSLSAEGIYVPCWDKFIS